MAFSLITNSVGQPTTSAVDTTGANLIILFIAGDISTTVTDSKSNTWTGLTTTISGNPSGTLGRFYYCYNPTVGASHTFTYSGIDYGTICMAAFSGSSSSPLDQQNGTASLSTAHTSLAPGSITPTIDNELIVTGVNLGANASNPTINSGFTISNYINGVPGSYYGGSMAYKIQTTSGAENPTWSWTNNQNQGVSVIASFKTLTTNNGNFFQLF